MKLNYSSIHTTKSNEYSLTVDSNNSVTLVVTAINSRITDSYKLSFDGGIWCTLKYGIDPVLQFVIQYYVKQFKKDILKPETLRLLKAKEAARNHVSTSNGQGEFQVDSFHSFRAH